jgi:hypothetical protein
LKEAYCGARKNSKFISHRALLVVRATPCNLATLEFFLRVFLYEKEASTDQRREELNLTTLKAGDHVSRSALTDYGSLEQVILQYNTLVRGNPKLIIDIKIAKVRDAIAHGRVFGVSGAETLTLLKFKRPKKHEKGVKVEFVESLTLQWLEAQITRVGASLEKVADAINPYLAVTRSNWES